MYVSHTVRLEVFEQFFKGQIEFALACGVFMHFIPPCLYRLYGRVLKCKYWLVRHEYLLREDGRNLGFLTIK
jgi:hypothetical protein